MRVAVFSDIHSNNIAMEACIDFLKTRDIYGVIFLGDNISDCPNPQATLKLIKDIELRYKTWHINGNREEYFIRYAKGEESWSYSSNKGSLLYTYEHLTKEDIDCFEARSNQMVVEIEGTAPIRIVHGSPGNTRELLYGGEDNTKKYLTELEEDYLLCGHSHRQFTYTYNGKLLLNPGSVGVAINVKEKAQFAMLQWKEDIKKWDYELVGVSFDFERLRKIFYDSALMEKANMWPKCILKSIETGVNYAPLCVKKSYELATDAGEELEWLCVPEKYWESAAKELNIIDG